MLTSGIDLWTTNTVAGYSDEEISESWTLVPLGINRIPTRTVLYEDDERNNTIAFWDIWFREYMRRRVGRLLESPKSFLNTPEEIETMFGGRLMSLSDIIALFLREIKEKMELQAKSSIDTVILWRPVHFHDKDKNLDQLAQKRLENAARKAWFKNITFELEPIAAAKSFDACQIQTNQLVLVADLGWGTSDFSLLKKQQDGNFEVLWNDGIYIGWNNFDSVLSFNCFADFFGKWLTYRDAAGRILDIPIHYFTRLWDWYLINTHLGTREKEHYNQILCRMTWEDRVRFWRLFQLKNEWKGFDYHRMVEEAKIGLSDSGSFGGRSDFLQNDFSYNIWRILFENSTQELVHKLQKKLRDTAQLWGRKPTDIHKVLLTWGTSQIPIVRRAIWQEVGWDEKLVDLDPFSAVGKGLLQTWRKHY